MQLMSSLIAAIVCYPIAIAIFSFQSSQIVLNDMVRGLPFSVPPLAPGNGSVSTRASAQTQLQLEFGLPLTEVSVATGGH